MTNEITAKYRETSGAAIQPWETSLPVLLDKNRELFDLRFFDSEGSVLTEKEVEEKLGVNE